MIYSYRKASVTDLEHIWAKNIADNLGDNRWITWKNEFLENNISGKALTFVIACDDDLIGEGSLLLSPECDGIRGRKILSDSLNVANINALRIQKQDEGKGHISRLMIEMESYSLKNGYSFLTIGVEARETRNLAIYLHWGYTELVMHEIEDGELILYYRKELK